MDTAVAANVGVVDRGYEFYLWRAERIVLWQSNLQFKYSPFVNGASFTFDPRLYKAKILGIWHRHGDRSVRILCYLLQFVVNSFSDTFLHWLHVMLLLILI